jgi:hypothetical protein
MLEGSAAGVTVSFGCGYDEVGRLGFGLVGFRLW